MVLPRLLGFICRYLLENKIGQVCALASFIAVGLTGVEYGILVAAGHELVKHIKVIGVNFLDSISMCVRNYKYYRLFLPIDVELKGKALRGRKAYHILNLLFITPLIISKLVFII